MISQYFTSGNLRDLSSNVALARFAVVAFSSALCRDLRHLDGLSEKVNPLSPDSGNHTNRPFLFVNVGTNIPVAFLFARFASANRSFSLEVAVIEFATLGRFAFVLHSAECQLGL
jgi:hypothetical protein